MGDGHRAALLARVPRGGSRSTHAGRRVLPVVPRLRDERRGDRARAQDLRVRLRPRGGLVDQLRRSDAARLPRPRLALDVARLERRLQRADFSRDRGPDRDSRSGDAARARGLSARRPERGGSPRSDPLPVPPAAELRGGTGVLRRRTRRASVHGLRQAPPRSAPRIRCWPAISPASTAIGARRRAGRSPRMSARNGSQAVARSPRPGATRMGPRTPIARSPRASRIRAARTSSRACARCSTAPPAPRTAAFAPSRRCR